MNKEDLLQKVDPEKMDDKVVDRYAKLTCNCPDVEAAQQQYMKDLKAKAASELPYTTSGYVCPCEEEDILYLAGENDFLFSAYVGREGNFSKHRVRNISEFINHIDSLDKDDEGYSYISQYSLIKIYEVKNDKNLVIARIKGYFKYPPKVQKDFIFFSGQFPDYPSLLVPAGKVFSNDVKFIQMDWKNSDGFFWSMMGILKARTFESFIGG